MRKLYVLVLLLIFVLNSAQNVFYDDDLIIKESYTGFYNYAVTGGSLRQYSDEENLAYSQCYVKDSDTAPLQDIPAGATIEKAYLYWAGSGLFQQADGTWGGDRNVTIKADTGANFSPTIKNDYFSKFSMQNVSSPLYHFSYTADITNYVIEHGNTNYTFSDLTVNDNNPYCDAQVVVAGWAIVVIYKDLTQTRQKRVNLYEGLDVQQYNSSSFTLNELNVPPSPEAKVTGIFWEGDVKYGSTSAYSEALIFSGNELTDAINPQDNIFNNTRNYPNSSNEEFGGDIDTYDVGAYLNTGDQSATLQVSVAQDLVLSNVIIMESDTYVPKIKVVKSSNTNDAGVRLNVGDVITYSIDITNETSAKEAAYKVNVTDVLPNGVTYVGPVNRKYITGPQTNRTTQTDTTNDPLNLFSASEDLRIYPGETFSVNYTVEITAEKPFEKTNSASFTADNYTDPKVGIVTDKMVICRKSAPSGTPRTTQVGISTLKRNQENWLSKAVDNQLGGYIYLESSNKGFAITQLDDPNTIQNPVEGMMVWDKVDECLKLYQVNNGTGQWSPCLTQGCNE